MAPHRASGAFYIADTDNCRARLVSGGTISTVAGTGTCGFAGDFGLATAAQLNIPVGLALGDNGELVISDQGNHRLRTVLPGSDNIVNGGGDEPIVTSAGGATPTPGFCGDPDPNPTPPPEVIPHLATDACLNTPAGLARAGDNFYLSDQGNDRVRKIPADCDLDGLLNSEETGLPGDTEACIADTDVDGHKDPQSNSRTGANLDPNQDNCPINNNPNQENTDSGVPPPPSVGGGIGNGTSITGDDATIPNGDPFGDACDDDRDNDGIPNGSDPHPGGDITYDTNRNGNPCVPLGTDAADHGPSWDWNCNGVRDSVEGSCPLAVNPNGDDDGDGLKNT